jgi:hypothetical protein
MWKAARPALPHARTLTMTRSLVAPCASVKSFSLRCIEVIRVRGAAALTGAARPQPSSTTSRTDRFMREKLSPPLR